MDSNRKRVVLVTGCSSGIGRATCEALLARGHFVWATARRDESVDELNGRLSSQFADRLFVRQLDITDEQSMDAIVRECAASDQAPQILVNNAGYGQIGAIEDVSSEQIRDQLETNVVGTFELTRRMIPFMRRKGAGRIINVSSVVAHISTPLMGVYNASKAALNALSESLRMELRGSGIDVVLVEPGVIRTDFRVNADQTWTGLTGTTDSRYHRAYEFWWNKWQDRLAGDMTPPSAVAAKMVCAVEARRPKTRYKITRAAYIAPLVHALLPDRLVDRLITRGFGLPDKPAD